MYNNFSSVDVTLYNIIFHDFEIAGVICIFMTADFEIAGVIPIFMTADFEVAGVIPIFMTADFEVAGVIPIFMTADYQPISGITRRIDDVIYLNFRVTWEAPETC